MMMWSIGLFGGFRNVFVFIIVNFVLLLECVEFSVGAETEDGGNANHKDTNHTSSSSDEGVEIVGLNYTNVKEPLIFTIVICLTAISKIAFHRANFLSSKIPESCVLIVLGTICGIIFYFSGLSHALPQFFEPHEFFMYLLPPIILEASFSLHDKTFADNLGSILLFAVLGTVLAATFIGLSLFGLAKAGAMGTIADMSFVEVMVFASLIVAVDPVAVLAVFSEIGVNHVLYFLVFGESLLNDGVTVVLYNVFQSYNTMTEITGTHVVLGIIKFFVVCIGGLSIGIVAGLATALLTQASKTVQVAQPIFIYAMAYLGYLLSDSFELSGLISIIGCGLTQRQYAFKNISEKSATATKYFTHVISTMCEIIIFLYLGLAMVTDDHDLHIGFTAWTIVLCLVFRFIIIFGISFFINRLDSRSMRKISIHEQFMIAYGGLRGAVCFSLVALLKAEEFPRRNMFVTTTLAVIIFTVFIQGATIRPLVYLMKITMAPDKKDNKLYAEFQNTVMVHVMAGIEGIVGDPSKNGIREKLVYLNDTYFLPFFTKPDPQAAQLKELYDHLILKEHSKFLKLSGVKSMQNAPELPHVASDIILSGMNESKPTWLSNVTSRNEPFDPDTYKMLCPRIKSKPIFEDIELGESRSTKKGNGRIKADPDFDVAKFRQLFDKGDRLFQNLRGRGVYKEYHDTIGAEIQSKSIKNQRLERALQSNTKRRNLMRSKSTASESNCGRKNNSTPRLSSRSPYDRSMSVCPDPDSFNAAFETDFHPGGRLDVEDDPGIALAICHDLNEEKNNGSAMINDDDKVVSSRPGHIETRDALMMSRSLNEGKTGGCKRSPSLDEEPTGVFVRSTSLDEEKTDAFMPSKPLGVETKDV